MIRARRAGLTIQPRRFSRPHNSRGESLQAADGTVVDARELAGAPGGGVALVGRGDGAVGGAGGR